jgi:hypothetical protein
VPGSIDIRFVFEGFFRVGKMDGLWMFTHGRGKRVIVRYRPRLNDNVSYAEIQPLLLA